MKIVLFLAFTFSCCLTSAIGQTDTIAAQLYSWNDLNVEKLETYERRPILEGSTRDMEIMRIHASTLRAGEMPHPSHIHADEEELVIVKEGKLEVIIEGKSTIVGAGSAILILPGDEHGFANAGDTDATYYILKYRSRATMDVERGQREGGSFVLDWNDIKFKPHDKGGVRSYFDRPTAMSKRMEMHVTTLKMGFKSHEPHTHRAAEFILMLEGDTEMQIGENFYQGKPGDLYFASSEIPHAIRNTGDRPAIYFAFQFE